MKIMNVLGESLTKSMEDIGGQFKDMLNKKCEKLVNEGYYIKTKCESCEHVYDNDFETQKYYNLFLPTDDKKKVKTLHEAMAMNLNWKKGLQPVTCMECNKGGVYIKKKKFLKQMPK